MTINTQKLRDLLGTLNEYPWDVDTRNKLIMNFPIALEHIDAQAAEIDGLRAELEHRSAYWITHKGAVLACSNSMRDAYSDEKVRADAAEAEIARLRADQAEKDAEIRSLKHELASMRFRLSGVNMRRQAPIARAALSGEGKC